MLYIGLAEGTSGPGSTSVATATTLNVAAGDILVAAVMGSIGGGRTVSSVSDGGSNNLTVSSDGSFNGFKASLSHILSASANATATLTATITGGSANSDLTMIVMQFRPEAGETVSLIGATALAGAVGTSIATATLSSTQDNSLFIGCLSAVNTVSAHDIGGTPTLTEEVGTNDFMSYNTFSATATGVDYTATQTPGQSWAASLIGFEWAASASVIDINTDEDVTDGEQNATFTTSGFSGEITGVNLVSGSYSLAATGVTSTSGAGDFDVPDISAYATRTASIPFGSIDFSLTDGTDTATLAGTLSVKSGWAVQTITGAVKTTGSVFENFVGTIADGSQVYYPTANNTSIDATGIITTDSTTDIDMQFGEVDTGVWYWEPFTALIEEGAGPADPSDPIGSTGDTGMIRSNVKSSIKSCIRSFIQ